MKTIMYNGHRIDVKGFPKDKVYYDGKEVSSKVSMAGSTHIFRVNEDGEKIQYEVQINSRWHGLSWWCEIRRKGEIIFTDR